MNQIVGLILLVSLLCFAWLNTNESIIVQSDETFEFVFHPEVKNAIANGLPVVALESTIISHGNHFIL